MVSTRSHSVLSAEVHGDTAATRGEVSSAAPTPRRSGRLRSSGAQAAEQAPPRTSTRSAASRLRAIQEEQEAHREAVQEVQQEAEQQQQGEAAEAVNGTSARHGAASGPGPAAGEEQQQEAQAQDESEAAGESDEEQAAGDRQPLKAGRAVVDRLAEEMFAALNEAFGEKAGDDSDSSEEEEEEEEEQQQQQGQAGETSEAASEDEAEAATSEEDDSDSGSGSDGEGRARDTVPRHLRWQPELTLPGMDDSYQQRRQGRGHQPRGGKPASAAAAAAAAVPGVHAVRKGAKKDALHVPPPDERALLKAQRKAAPDTAGRGWFDLPATQITDEVKRDLRLIRLRGALDPKAHYKKLDSTKFPKYFQIGTVVEGAADFYSGRLTRKQRKRTLTEEIMADPELAQVRKKRYLKMQEERQYWGNKKGRKTDNERRKKPHHRAKH